MDGVSLRIQFPLEREEAAFLKRRFRTRDLTPPPLSAVYSPIFLRRRCVVMHEADEPFVSGAAGSLDHPGCR